MDGKTMAGKSRLQWLHRGKARNVLCTATAGLLQRRDWNERNELSSSPREKAETERLKSRSTCSESNLPVCCSW